MFDPSSPSICRASAGVAASRPISSNIRLIFMDLLRIGLGQLAAFDEQAVLESHAHVAAHQRGLRQKWHLMPAGSQHRPLKVGGSEQPVGGSAS